MMHKDLLGPNLGTYLSCVTKKPVLRVNLLYELRITQYSDISGILLSLLSYVSIFCAG